MTASLVHLLIYSTNDSNFHTFPQNDFVNSLVIPRKEGAAGIIIWGASNDVNTKQKCQSLDEFARKTLGPIAERFLQSQKEDVYTLYETRNSSVVGKNSKNEFKSKSI